MSRAIRYDVSDIEELRRLAKCVAGLLEPGDIILLEGDLGAGKTTFVRFLAGFVGIDQRQVTSPTFALVHHYQAKGMGLVHADMYRLGPGADAADTGLYDYLSGDDIVAVEWAEYLAEPLGPDALRIRLSVVGTAREGGLRRQALLIPEGAGWEARAGALISCLFDGRGRAV